MASRLLIVDDDPMMLQALSAMVELRLPTVTIDTCESAPAALERIGQTDYDAIVSDVKMPGMDGFQLMERVLKIRPTTPTLLVTGHGDHDMGVKALNAGAYAFVLKPIDRDFFLAWLKRAIQLRQLSRTVERHTEELKQTVEERTAELEQNNRQLQSVAELHRASEALYRSMAEAMPQIVYTTRPDAVTDYVNQQWVDYTGLSQEQALKLEWAEVLHPDDVQNTEARWRETVTRGQIFEAEYRLRRADGEYRWHLSRAVPVRDEEGNIIKWIGTSTDIHSRKTSEVALRESEDRYKRLVKYSPDAILINRNNRIVFVNEAGLAIFGASHRDQLLGKSTFDLFHSDCHPLVKQRIERLSDDGKSLAMSEERIIRLDGTIADVEVVESTFLDQGRRAIHLILRDITERKRAEEALRESEQRYRVLYGALPVAAFVCDANAVIQNYNRRAVELWGREPQVGVERHCGSMKLILPDGTVLPHAQSPMMEVLRTGVPARNVEVFIERPDGSRIPVIVNFCVLKDAQGEIVGVVTSFDDVTERKQAEEALRESAERLRFMAESMPQKIFTAKPNGDVDYFNRQWTEFTGLTFEQIRDWGWLQFIHPDDVEENIRRWRHSIETGEPFQFEHRFRRADGVYRWHLSRAQAMRDADGQAVMWIGSNTDIDDQKRAEEQIRGLLRETEHRAQELREKQGQLIQSAKLASIGELASGVAHELNNPLNNIGLIIGNVLDQITSGQIDPPRMRRNLKTTLRQVHKAVDIINHLRTFARTSATLPEPVSLHHVIRSAVSLVESQLRMRNIELGLHLCQDHPMVLGNAIQLEQVFINLLTNAADAVERAAEKRIAIASTIQGAQVEVTVRDTGIGIPPEHQARIFDPFFTTKDVGKGTGLGLSISYGIIKDHQGKIGVHSEPDKGTTFTIRLPLAPNSPESCAARGDP